MKCLDYIKKRLSGLLTPDVQETVTGTAQILEIFKVSGAGKVAGSKVVMVKYLVLQVQG